MLDWIPDIVDKLAAEVGKILGGMAAGMLAFFWIKLRTRILDFLPYKLRYISINASTIDIKARDLHEQYDHGLAIHIDNQGGPNCYIVSAAFRPRMRGWPFQRRAALPIYPGAFFSRRHKNAYEIKFGRSWTEPDILLRSGQRILTYVPLAKPVPDELIAARKSGTVFLEFATEERVGTHRAAV